MIEFDHSEDDVMKAIKGATVDGIFDVMRNISEDPKGVLGGKFSETAEYIIMNVDDPSSLAFITRCFMHGISKTFEESMKGEDK